MKIRELLRNKGFEVIAVDCEAGVQEAIDKMVERDIGAVLAVGDGCPDGVFTERDVLKCWAQRKTFEDVKVKDFMSKKLIVVEIDEDISNAMSIMIEKKIRHLPVVDEKGSVVSVLSIRDVVKANVGKIKAEVHFLTDYISDKYPG